MNDFANDFKNCSTIEEGKKIFRTLVKKTHPDVNPNSTEDMKKLNLAFENFLENFIQGRVDEFNSNHDFDINSFMYSDILKQIINMNIEIEIIGVWIYVRKSFEVKDQLKELGFWFSSKHKAWVFSGSAKKKVRTNFKTLDEVRDFHGSDLVKDKEEQKRLA